MRRPMLSPGWLALHALTAVLAVAFLALGWWQLRRGVAGNIRSYAYALEWPLFAVFVVFMWWRIRRDSRRSPSDSTNDATAAADTDAGANPGPAGAPTLPRVLAARVRSVSAPGVRSPQGARVRGDEPDGPAESDDRLAAYNRYLAELHARDERAQAGAGHPKHSIESTGRGEA